MKKNIWKFYPVLLIAIIILFFEVKGCKEREKFFQTELSSKISKIKGNWSGGRSYDYITNNNVIITLINTDTLQIGDSIVKKSNTGKFDVYRKQGDHYVFYKNYTIER